MSEIERLRNEAKKLRASVSAKIARTKRTTGANVAGTEYDPRRAAGIEGRYNKAQLNRYIESMKPFMSRNRQFVADANNGAIPRHEYRTFKKTLDEYHAVANARDLSMGDIMTPLGFTIRQQQAMQPQSHGSAVYGPYKRYDDITSKNLESADAMRKMREDLVKKLKSGYLESKIEQGRENLDKALRILGRNEFNDRLDDLSSFQFDALWYGTTFAQTVFMQYGIEQERAAGTRKERWQDKVIEDASDELGELLDWASNEVPRERPQNAAQIYAKKRPRR